MTIGVRRMAAWVAALVAGGLLAACSSSGGTDTVGPDATGSSSQPPPSSSVPSVPSVPASSVPSVPASPPAADAATTQAVTAAFKKFFNSKTTPADSQAALQHGEAFKQTLEEQAKGAYSKDSGVNVASVTGSGPVLNVTFTLTSGGAPLLSNIKGFAVKEDGQWKVAAATFCVLLKLEGSPPPACSDSSITALPQ